ncbi:MAG: hypothetical protein WCT23_08125 [Candidatus Neomarinimicrobiota bacterium]
MKKALIVLFVLFSLASAEILVMGVDLDTVDKHYIRLSIGGGFINKIFAYVDYGQAGRDRHHVVIEEEGNKREFNSEIQILNLFYEHGWEIKAAITEPSGGSDGSSVYGDTYYILERMDEK